MQTLRDYNIPLKDTRWQCSSLEIDTTLVVDVGVSD